MKKISILLLMVVVTISTSFALTKPQIGVDISHHNGKENFAKLKKNKVAFVVCKATEGKTLKDKTYSQNVLSAKKMAWL
jgi:lysozyme